MKQRVPKRPARPGKSAPHSAPARPAREAGPVQPAAPMQRLQQAVGNRGLTGWLQSGVASGAANAAAEGEADRVAAAVSAPVPLPGAAPVSGAVPATGIATSKAAAGGAGGADIAAGLGAGRRLPEAVRRDFEPRLGASLAGVRVHTGADAAATARQVGARAFAVGRDVVFGAGQFAPATAAGRYVLAHELTHVLQQGRPGAVLRPQFLLEVTATGRPPGTVELYPAVAGTVRAEPWRTCAAGSRRTTRCGRASRRSSPPA